jgi:hypothetical protein
MREKRSPDVSLRTEIIFGDNPKQRCLKLKNSASSFICSSRSTVDSDQAVSIHAFFCIDTKPSCCSGFRNCAGVMSCPAVSLCSGAASGEIDG